MHAHAVHITVGAVPSAQLKVINDTFHGLADADGRRHKTPLVPKHIQAAVQRLNQLYTSQLLPRLDTNLPSLQALCLGLILSIACNGRITAHTASLIYMVVSLSAVFNCVCRLPSKVY